MHSQNQIWYDSYFQSLSYPGPTCIVEGVAARPVERGYSTPLAEQVLCYASVEGVLLQHILASCAFKVSLRDDGMHVSLHGTDGA